MRDLVGLGPTRASTAFRLAEAADRRAHAFAALGVLAAACSTPAPVSSPWRFDDRKEYYELSPQLKVQADSVVAVTPLDALSFTDDAVTIRRPRTLPTCADQPFRNEPVLGYCSGVLVGPDLVLTAAHCLVEGTTRIVFGFRMDSAGSLPVTFPLKDVYSVESVVAWLPSPLDFCVIRLDRTVADHHIAVLGRGSEIDVGSEVYTIGDPWSLPQKYSGEGRVMTRELELSNGVYGTFSTDLAVLRGDSGGPVFDAATHSVQGIVTARAFPDRSYDTGENCIRPLFCDRGESCCTAYYVRSVTPVVPGTSATYFVNIDEAGRRTRADAVAVDVDAIRVALSRGDALGGIQTSPAEIGIRANYLADVDGDGRADVIAVGSDVRVRRANGSGFDDPEVWPGIVAQDAGNRGLYFADVDGDGRGDAIRVDEDVTNGWNTTSLRVARSLGSADRGFSAPELWITSTDETYARYGWRFTDVNADGRADAVRFAEDAVVVALSTGERFAPWQIWWSGAYRGAWFTGLADVDGDGAADLVTVDAAQISVRLAERRSSQFDHFGATGVWLAESFSGQYGTAFADLDGDGTADAIAIDADRIRVRSSTKSGFGLERVWLDKPLFGHLGLTSEALP